MRRTTFAYNRSDMGVVEIAGIVAAAAGVIAILIALGAWLLPRASGNRAKGKSVIARDVRAVKVGDKTSASDAGTAVGAGSHVEVHHHYANSEDQEHFQASISEKLDILLERSVATPAGASQPETTALVASATDRTQRLLSEAIDLQNQHKEREAIERLLTAYDMEMSAKAKGQLHLLVGNGYLRLFELEEAEGHFKETLRAAEEAGDRWLTGAATGSLGLVYRERGNLDKAEEHARKGLAIFEEIGNPVSQGSALGELGLIHAARGDLDKAEDYLKKALELNEYSGNRRGEAIQLGNLGTVYYDGGELERAKKCLSRSLAIHSEIGNKLGQAAQLLNLGNIYEEQGDLDRGAEYYAKALELANNIGDRNGQAKATGNLGIILRKRGRFEDAEKNFRSALLLHQECGYMIGQAHQTDNLGDLCVDQRDPKLATNHYQDALDTYRRIGAARYIAIVEEKLARLGDDRND